MKPEFLDAQANLGFVISQTTHIEAGVYTERYPDIDYASFIPVDTSAPEWVKTVTFFSMDHAGAARFISGNAKDIPVVGTERSKFESAVHMAGLGYDYGLEEVSQARMLGIPLEAENARAARRISDEFIYTALTTGATEKSMSGLFNYPGVSADALPTDGTGSSALWSTKTPDQIIRDVNNLLIGVHTATNTVAMADTLLLPWSRMLSISSRRVTDGDSNTILRFIRENNVYTAATGTPLTIRGMRGLDNPTGGSPAAARMIAYRRSPEVLKAHIPMPHRFLPVQVQGLQFVIPGIFRFGGLDIRLPKEVRYGDGL